MSNPIEAIINKIQSEIEYANDAIDEARLEARFDPLIPKAERADTCKRARIDGIEGTIKHYDRLKSMNRMRLNQAANHFLKSAGFNWDATASKSRS
jgi:hypothetical protein